MSTSKAPPKPAESLHLTPQAMNRLVKNICVIMRRGNCAGAMQYVPELTWILFLCILDKKEHTERQHHEAVGRQYVPTLEEPYRWRDWAAPTSPGNAPANNKRWELQNSTTNSFFHFVNSDLLPHLKSLKNKPNATPLQKVISEIMSGVDRVRIDTERNFLDVLDRVHEISTLSKDLDHMFALSQIYEGLLLKMGEKGNDGGQFFTPRQVIKTMVKVINPQIGETVHDPCCGTGGFLAQSYEHIYEHIRKSHEVIPSEHLEILKTRTFSGREKENLVYPIALANLVLHEIDYPCVWHGNTLTGQEIYGGLFDSSQAPFDVILTNPPFGGQEGREAQTAFPYPHRSTQVLFLQHIIQNLSPTGRCGIVLDEGVLFRMDEQIVKTKRMLLDSCDLWCIVSLPAGVFASAGAGVKTNLLFFTRGGPTKKIWYYDLTDIKVRKKAPLTLSDFHHFFELLPDRAESELSWTEDLETRKTDATTRAQPAKNQAARLRKRAEQEKGATKAKTLATAQKLEKDAERILSTVYNLKAVNPNKKITPDFRAPGEIVTEIGEASAQITALLERLRRSL